MSKPIEERYEDCDRCGERYIIEEGEPGFERWESGWLRDEERAPSEHFDETWRVCCPPTTSRAACRGDVITNKEEERGDCPMCGDAPGSYAWCLEHGELG